MIKNCVTVLDVGSSGITVLVGQRGVNDTITERFATKNEYSGFAEGKFFDIAELESAVASAIKSVCAALKTTVNEITVCVPGAFVRLENRKYKIVFGKKKKITEDDKDDLFDAGQDLVGTEGYEVINRSEIYFALDDNKKVFDPVGRASSMLGGYINYTLCEKYFIDTFRNALKKAGVTTVNFVFDALAESLYLFDSRRRETPSLIIDSGYITTTASIVLGGGVVAKHSEDFGGGLIAYRIVKTFGIAPDVADGLQRIINLSLARQSGQTYKIETKNGYEEYLAEEINSAATEEIDLYLDNLEAFIAENIHKVNGGFGVYLTGGGLSYVRGIKEYISARLGLPVEIVKPKLPSYGKTEETSYYAALDYALNEQKKKKKGFLGFFRK